jgi:hypothetical protein
MPLPRPRVELYESGDGRWHVQYVTAAGRVADWAPGVDWDVAFAHRRSARKAARRDHPGVAIVLVDD